MRQCRVRTSHADLRARSSVKGTQISPQTGQTITSIGNPSFNELLGGGVPMNGIVLIEEDKHCVYSRVLCKYFLAEGVVKGHKIFLACLDQDPQNIVTKLPQPVQVEKSEPPQNQQMGDLRIAWRYNDLPHIKANKNPVQNDYQFNLSVYLTSDDMEYPPILFDGVVPEGEEEKSTESNDSTDRISVGSFGNDVFQRLLDDMIPHLRTEDFWRICIQSLGSPLWYGENFEQDLLRFLTILRALVQNSKCVCFITMPMHLIESYDKSLVPKIRNLVDFALELESFAATDHEFNPTFKEYHGWMHFKKMSAINSIGLFQHSDLAFKLKRKKFQIEKFHLPPELDVLSAQATKPSVSCSSGGSGNLLDF